MHADKCILDIIPDVSSPMVTEVASGYVLHIARRIGGRSVDAAKNKFTAENSDENGQLRRLQPSSVDEADLVGVKNRCGEGSDEIEAELDEFPDSYDERGREY